MRVHEMIGPSDALLAGVGVDPDDAGRRRCRRSRVGLLLDAAGCGVGGGQASVVVRHHVHEARVQKGWGPSRCTVENLAPDRRVVAVGDDAALTM